MSKRFKPGDPLVEYGALSIFCLIVVLNTLDALFTIIGVELGFFVEANPLMDYLLMHGSWSCFFVGKALMGFFGAVLLYAGRYHEMAWWSYIVAMAMSIAILCNHLYLYSQL